LASLEQVEFRGDTVCVTATDSHSALRQLFELLELKQVEISSLTTRHASLEDVFVRLTGRHLNDELTG